MGYLRKSTAVTVPMGPFLATDGVTRKTAIASVVVVEVSQNNGVFAARGATGAVAHDQEGWYRVPLAVADVGTAGRVVAKSEGSGYLPVWHEWVILPSGIYDALLSGVTKRQVDVRQWVGTSVTGPTATGRIKVDVRTWVGATVTGPTASGFIKSRLVQWLTTAPNALVAGRVQVDTLASAASVWTAAGRTLSSGAAVWAATPRRLSATGIDDVWDELASGHVTASGFGSRLDAKVSSRPLASTVWGYSSRLLSSGAAVWAAGTRSLTEKTGFRLSATGVDDIWDEPAAAHTASVNMGGRLDAKVSSRPLASGIWTYTSRLLTSGSVVWGAAARTLTSAGVAWTAGTRVLTSGSVAADAVWARSLAELAAMPAAGPPASQAMMFLYMSARNKRITTATGDKVHNSATTVLFKAAVSASSTTFTKQKYALAT